MGTDIKQGVLTPNNKYSSTRGVYAMLSKAHSGKMAGIGLYTVADWCSTVIRDYLGSYHAKVEVKNFPLGYPRLNTTTNEYDMLVANGTVPVPIGVHRLLFVYDQNGNQVRNFHYDGSKVVFLTDEVPTAVTADFIALPFEENPEGGLLPLIIAGGEMACYYFCLKMLYEEDFTLGRISGAAFGYFNQNFNEEVACFSPIRHISEQEMENAIEVKNTYYGHPFEYSFTNSHGNF